MTAHPPAADLAKVRDEIRAEIREARGMLKDLRHEIKEARRIVPLLVEDLFHAEVEKQLEELGEQTRKSMDDCTDKVIHEFDKLYKTLTGQTGPDRKQGNTPVPEIIQQHVADMNTGQDQP